ncbi:MAG: methylmalonyl Co-A mutase-associated GTPase MeaB [Acidaminococcales bacterium]|jgi:LAO/AO transport system kinase|nr:methylmalonyl Co-A mutase-associated GTPase MeaB [Acidaminococcales bacterium]
MRKINIDELITKFAGKDRRAFAKAISIVEDNEQDKDKLLDYAYEQAAGCESLIIGVTGAGGAGKSTLIDKLICEYRKMGKNVGVIAVDPSSPYTGGAVLGDRIRMSSHNCDDGVYIRSLGSRGAWGGISDAAKDVLYLYKVFGFDVIILESLGVGQAETEITNFVDVTVVVLAPGFGDAIQMAKAGVQEIADVFVINKADKPEAENLYMHLISTFDTLPVNEQPLVVKTVASEGKGMDTFVAAVAQAAEKQIPKREQKRVTRIEHEILSDMHKTIAPGLLKLAKKLAGKVLAKEISLMRIGENLKDKIRIDGS